MRLALILLATLMLVSCDGPNTPYGRAVARQAEIDKQIAEKGYAEVGKTPDGQPLYMKKIDTGYGTDNVYFTKDSITATENCGKNCEKAVTTIRKPL